jgi:nucleoside-diphosphate-sugar epimerase
MNVLITGCLGYLGSVLTKYLEDAGYNCTGFDTGFFRDCLLYKQTHAGARYIDVRDLTHEDLEGHDVVVHLAGISNDPMGQLDAATIYDPTREYSNELATMCKQLGIRLIFASSCSVYGVGTEELMTEESQVNPQTFYSQNKKQIEEDLASLSDNNFSPIALRFATVFGLSPRIRFDIVVNMLVGMAVSTRRIVLNSDGLAWRPNLHILDLCEAVKRAIQLDYDGGKLLILNVGSEDNNHQVIEIARMIQECVTGSEINYLSVDSSLDNEGLIRDRKVADGKTDNRSYRVSFQKIRKVLPGFECHWSVKRGIQQMADLFMQLPLTRETFKRADFYRLQKLEALLSSGHLSKDLLWQK